MVYLPWLGVYKLSDHSAGGGGGAIIGKTQKTTELNSEEILLCNYSHEQRRMCYLEVQFVFFCVY